MFGYTIVKKIYIKRLKEELQFLNDMNQKLDNEASELKLRARMVEWDLDRNQPMRTTMLEQIETREQIIAALTGENEELRLQIAGLEAKLKW